MYCWDRCSRACMHKSQGKLNLRYVWVHGARISNELHQLICGRTSIRCQNPFASLIYRQATGLDASGHIACYVCTVGPGTSE